MDYLMRYPTTKHQHDAILLVVDRFSKMDILIPCKKTTTTQNTNHLFFEHVWKNYGLSTTIIFDRDCNIPDPSIDEEDATDAAIKMGN